MRNIGISLLIAVGAFCGIASGGTVYSNLSSNGPIYDCCGGWTVAGPGNPFSSFLTIDTPAFAFTPGGNFQFTQLDVAAAYVGAGANTLTIDLRADASFLPGAVLETWT